MLGHSFPTVSHVSVYLVSRDIILVMDYLFQQVCLTKGLRK